MTYIDCDELAVRIGEACASMRRPPNITAREAFEQIQQRSPDSAQGFLRAAMAAAEYIAECCNASNPGSVEVTTVIAETESRQ